MRLDAPLDQIGSLRARIEIDAARASSLEGAAQLLARELYGAFTPATVLSRVYATVRMDELPSGNQTFVEGLAAARGGGRRLLDATPVLSLLGTHGREIAWRDRHKSRDHAGIPLLDKAFVASIPMVARLLTQVGFDLSWLDRDRDSYARSLVGGFNGVFYVPDAATSVDEAGRLVIPAQDFVSQYGVKSVFGMGGAYVDGTVVAAILFTNVSIPRAPAEQISTVLGGFKSATLPMVLERRFFEPRR